MGRIKTAFIKSIGNKLLEKYGDRFTDDFEKNKKIVEEVAEIHSKFIRNAVAGYITAIMKKKSSS